MFHVELAPWGVFLPSEVRFRGILALSRAWFYNGQKQKCKFLKKGSWPDFQILCGDSWGNFTKKMAQILALVNFFSVLTLISHCVGVSAPKVEMQKVKIRKYRSCCCWCICRNRPPQKLRPPKAEQQVVAKPNPAIINYSRKFTRKLFGFQRLPTSRWDVRKSKVWVINSWQGWEVYSDCGSQLSSAGEIGRVW